MNPVTVRHLAAALCSLLALAGCTSGANDQPSTEPTATTTTETTTSTSLVPACQDLVDKSQELVTEVGRFVTRDATAGDVQVVAAALAASFEDAKATLGPDAQADLDQAGRALQKVQDALAAQPVDTAGLRTAAGELFAALTDAAAICAGTSSSDASEPASETTSDESPVTVTATPTS